MTTQRRSLLRLLALLLSFVLIAAACGDDSDDGADDDGGTSVDGGDDDGSDDGGTDDGGTDDGGSDDGGSDDGGSDDGGSDDGGSDDVELTDSYRGVTSETITVGVSMLDFATLVDIGASPAGWGDYQAVWEALVADLNANGGINGRQVEAIYEFFNPIDADDATRVCTALTEDNETFAVLGGFLGPVNATNTCITQLNETILVGGNQNIEALENSVAPYYQPGAPDFARNTILLNLLEQEGRLDGAKVFVMGGIADEANHGVVIDLLEDRGIEVVGDNMYLAVDIEDTAAQDDELGIITEQIKQTDATAVFIHGTPSASIRGLAAAGLNETLDIWTNNPGGLNNLGETITDKSIANGVLTVGGFDDTLIYEDPAYREQCEAVVAAAVPEADLRAPADYAEEDENWFNSTRLACRTLDLFVQIATNAGADLTQDTFRAAAEAMDDFSIPGSPASSLGPDKPYNEDNFALLEYDSTAGDGMAVPITEYVDAFPS